MAGVARDRVRHPGRSASRQAGGRHRQVRSEGASAWSFVRLLGSRRVRVGCGSSLGRSHTPKVDPQASTSQTPNIRATPVKLPTERTAAVPTAAGELFVTARVRLSGPARTSGVFGACFRQWVLNEPVRITHAAASEALEAIPAPRGAHPPGTPSHFRPDPCLAAMPRGGRSAFRLVSGGSAHSEKVLASCRETSHVKTRTL